MTLHSVEHRVVQQQAPQVVGSLPLLEEFTEPVYNRVHKEQIVAGEMTLNIVENSGVQDQVIVQEIPQVQIVERIQEQIVETINNDSTGFTRRPQYELHVDQLELHVDHHRHRLDEFANACSTHALSSSLLWLLRRKASRKRLKGFDAYQAVDGDSTAAASIGRASVAGGASRGGA